VFIILCFSEFSDIFELNIIFLEVKSFYLVYNINVKKHSVKLFLKSSCLKCALTPYTAECKEF